MVFTPPTSYTAYAFLEKGGNLQKVTVDWRDPQPGEIVVKVLACGVCHSDTVTQFAQNPQVSYPRIPGHEIVGSVVAVHATEKIWKLGQVVGSGWHAGHDGTCVRCRKGDYVTCKNEAINGVNRDGGYAEYVTLRTEAVVAVPEGISPVQAAPLFCAGLTVFNGLRNSGARGGDLVAILGIGGLGHLALQFSRAMGFKTIALSQSDSKRGLVSELGAHIYIDGSKEDPVASLQALGGAVAILAVAPHADTIGSIIDGLDVDGKLVLIALSEDITIPASAMVLKRLSVSGSLVGMPEDMVDVLQFAQQSGIRCMVETFPLDKAQEAYDHVGKARFRAVLVP